MLTAGERLLLTIAKLSVACLCTSGAAVAISLQSGVWTALDNANGAICLDTVMNRDFSEPFVLLNRLLGVTEVALHLGKWNDPNELSLGPCRRVSIGNL